MKLAAIKRPHLLQAAEEMDAEEATTWTEYWMHITEKNKEYPFKLLVRKAYEKATGVAIDPYFFQSNTGYRKHFEQKFDYKVNFRIRDNVPFFTVQDIQYFKQWAGQPYRKEDAAAVVAGEALKKTVYSKSNTWARALNLEGFDLEQDNQWQISGYFKPYTWIKIYRSRDANKKVFFTVGVAPEEDALVFKLDCQRKSYNPDKALKPEQIEIFERIVRPTGGGWQEINAEELEGHDWESLVNTTKAFIEHYTPLYDEVLAAIWDSVDSTSPPVLPKTIRFSFPPKGIAELPLRSRRTSGPNSNPDYDKENKHKKQMGDLGEQLILDQEKSYLRSKGREDLAQLVCKVPDWEGYDILSFDETGKQKFIEVKTTSGTAARPFVFTINEKLLMEAEADKYYLYRLYNFDMEKQHADCFILKGNFSAQVLEEPVQYNIYVRELHSTES